MKASIYLVATALSASLATPVVMAETGEADASGCRAAASKPTTKAERDRARQARIAEGTQVASAAKSGDDQPCNTGTVGSASREERKAAASKRREATAEAVKRGDVTSGEK